MVFHSGASDRRVQCSRVGLEVKNLRHTSRGIRASQRTFSCLNVLDWPHYLPTYISAANKMHVG